MVRDTTTLNQPLRNARNPVLLNSILFVNWKIQTTCYIEDKFLHNTLTLADRNAWIKLCFSQFLNLLNHLMPTIWVSWHLCNHVFYSPYYKINKKYWPKHNRINKVWLPFQLHTFYYNNTSIYLSILSFQIKINYGHAFFLQTTGYGHVLIIKGKCFNAIN